MDDKSICEAAGFEVEQMTAEALRKIADRITNDGLVAVRAHQFQRTAAMSGRFMPPQPLEALLKTMSDIERAALRERVTR